MPGDSSDRLSHPAFARLCRRVLKAASVIAVMSLKRRPLSTKRWLPAAHPNCGQMPHRRTAALITHSAIASIAGFAALNSRCRNILGPWSAAETRSQDRPDIMTPNSPALQVRGLTKRFDRPAVDALDLTVRSGEFYALLGPNGAGKTTTLRMVAGLLKPDAGSVTILGIDALGRSRRRQADHGLGLGRADDLRQADAAGISRIRCRPLGHRSRGFPNAPRASSWSRSGWNRICTSAARDFPRACGRRWRWPARWCMTRA